jgi:hypothetical protein
MRLAALSFTLGLAALTRSAAAEPCSEPITPAIANAIFEGLARRAPEGCELDRVATLKSEMKITWKKGDQLLEPVVVVPASCLAAAGPEAAGKLSATVPESVEKACPGSTAATTAVIQGIVLETRAKVEAAAPAPKAEAKPEAKAEASLHPAVIVGAGLGVLALTAGAAFWLERRKRR